MLKLCLQWLQLKSCPEIVSTEKSELADAVQKTGYPLVMKVIGPLHKSDIGGVVLNIKNILNYYANVITIIIFYKYPRTFFPEKEK